MSQALQCRRSRGTLPMIGHAVSSKRSQIIDCMLPLRRAAVIKSCAAAAPAPTIGITSPIASAPGAGSGLTPSGGLAGLGLSPTGSPSSPSSTPSAASVQVLCSCQADGNSIQRHVGQVLPSWLLS